MVHLKFCGEFAVTRFVHRLEGGALLIEVEVGLAGRAVSVLFNEDFRDVWPIALGITLVLAVNEQHDVRILLNAPRIAQVAQAGLAAASLYARESCESAMTGTLSSRARDFNEREISVTCWTIESEAFVEVGAMS